jgi:large subunit ribosomal protein L10
MSPARPEKVAEVEALEQRLRSATVVILTDYRGLSVTEITTLRSRLRAARLEYRVAKNTLLNRAAEKVGVSDLSTFLSGPTAVVFGRDDPSVPARLLLEFIRQYRKLEIKGGLVDGQSLNAEAVQSLATLPTKRELLARVAGAVGGPLRGLVTALSGPPRGLVTVLDALRRLREESEGMGGSAAAGGEQASSAPASAGDAGQAVEPGPPETPAPEGRPAG